MSEEPTSPALGGSYVVDPETGERRRLAWTRPADENAVDEAMAGGMAGAQPADPEPDDAPPPPADASPATEPSSRRKRS